MQPIPEDIDLRSCRLLLETLKLSSLSLAAVSLGLKTSAASKRLAAMRQFFDDMLFVRSGGRMMPTDRMIELAPRLQSFLHTAESLRDVETTFSPAECAAVFRIAAVDNAALLCFRGALIEIARLAPHLSFEFENLEHETLDRLRSGVLDLALFGHRGQKLPPAFHDVLLTQCRHAMLVDGKHPLVAVAKTRRLRPEDLAPFRRVGITMNRPTGGHLQGIIDRLGTQADYALRIPHFLAGALFVEGTDFIVTLPEPLARIAARAGNLKVLEDPVDGKVPWVPSMVWHQRSNNDPLHQWVRSQILAAAKRMAE